MRLKPNTKPASRLICPISNHATKPWIALKRRRDINLRSGFFSAIDETLDFTSQEIEILSQQLPGDFKHFSLSNAFKQLVQQEKQIDEPNAEAMDELSLWLKNYLTLYATEQGGDDPAMGQILVDTWKKDQLLSICKEGFRHDLVHFACHCEASAGTELLSRLDMNIGGEVISFEVAQMADKALGRKLTSANEPGPLVFLNACQTRGTNSSHEPPGFPIGWIRQQGALAVVVTLCPVPDYFAHAFALKFYDFLLGAAIQSTDPKLARDCQVSEAFLATRRYFMEKFNNPLGLAYILYAARDVRISTN